jgi:hypothetical protein
MEEATKQRMDQLKAKQQTIAAPCPNPPCNAMQQRTPSIGSTGAMDRLGGGPSPALAGTKATVGAKPQNAAAKNENTQLKPAEQQKATQQLQQMQELQKKQPESSGAMMRKLP